jgi:hypothetical protein
MLVADLLKAGTAHDSKTGQFTSSSGASYSLKNDADGRQRHVHDADGKHIGSVTRVPTKNGAVTQHVGELASDKQKVIAGPKTSNSNSALTAGRFKTAQLVADAHEATSAKEKAMTIGDLFKAETAHGKDGRFVSTGGGMAYEGKGTRDLHPFTRKSHGTDAEGYEKSTKSVSAPDGAHIGTVESKTHPKVNEQIPQIVGGSLSGGKANEHVATPPGGEPKKFAKGVHAFQHLVDTHNAKNKMTIGELFKSAPRAINKAVFVGSFEDSLRRIHGPVCMGSGCSKKPAFADSGELQKSDDDGAHSLEVIATFGDKAYVRCSDEDQIWEIPFEFSGDEVTCGEPKLFEANAEAEEDEDEGNEGEEDEGDDEENAPPGDVT